MSLSLSLKRNMSLKRAASVPAVVITAGPDANGAVTQPGGGVFRYAKSGGGAAFNAGAYGPTHTGDFRYKFVVPLADYMISFDDTPAALSDFSDHDIAVYFAAGGSMTTYDGGVGGSVVGTYGAGDTIWVDRTGTSLTYKQGAVYASASLVRTVSTSATIGLDICMFTVGANLDITPS